MIYISPSLFAADASKLGKEVERVEDAGANYLHIDVMDGSFVPNLSFGPDIVKALRNSSMLIFDVHLMIVNPEKHFDSFIKAGADLITVHYEAIKDGDPEATLKYLKEREVKTGLAISPATPVDAIMPFVEKGLVDMVLVMTVNPGYGGQKFMPEMLDKVRYLRRYAEKNRMKLDIEVDGGINADNVAYCSAAGANVIVAGTAIFGAKKTNAVIKLMRTRAKENPFVE